MIYVFLGNGFEEIEAFTVVDILRRAELNVKTVGIGGSQIKGAHGITVVADIADSHADAKDIDMIVLPGGMPGTLTLESSDIVQAFIDQAVEKKLWIGAICAAPSILGHRGLLRGKKATCYPGYEEQLIDASIQEQPVVVDGKIITANGVGCSIQFALTLVEKLISRQRADLIKAAILYSTPVC